MRSFRFSPALPRLPAFRLGDLVILLGLASVLYVGARLAIRAPAAIAGPEISLSYWALPWYALLSTSRMAVAYVLSLVFSLVYGYLAARNRAAERVLMPLLDVLQSAPILSFLPVVLLSLSAILPQAVAVELAAIILIFTSQTWNMAFSVYQSLTTVPNDLREAAAIFRFDPWLRFRTLELPYASIGLIWNSMMSWAGGWFFLMAAEIFTVGSRDFRLAGLGAYLQTAANAGNVSAVLAGVVTLVLVIVLLDQFLWRPLIAWADKFKVEMVSASEHPTSWFLEVLSQSLLLERFGQRVLRPAGERLDGWLRQRLGPTPGGLENEPPAGGSRLGILLAVVLVLVVLYGGFRAAGMLLSLPATEWAQIGQGVFWTFLRVMVALLLTLLWTVPAGAAIGLNPRLAKVVQPIVQVLASIPATALFPVILLALIRLPGGLGIAAIVLMLMGTQWYVLFNVIAGAIAIPEDLREVTTILRLSRWERWRTLLLPALFPFIVTGAITAGGGAWNASIVAEYVQFGGQAHSIVGVGALITQATNNGDFALLIAGTLALVTTVVLINRLFWRPLYRVAEAKYHMD